MSESGMKLESPPRLLTLEGPERELIQQAQVGFRRGLDERGAFEKLDARLRTPWVARYRWPLGTSLAAAALALVVFGVPSLRAPVDVAITPETGPRKAVAARAPRAVAEQPAQNTEQPVVSVERDTRPRRPSVEEARPNKEAAPAAPRPVPATPAAEESCKDLQGRGELERASECYAKQAEGSGLSAEVALYQLGRLKRERGDVRSAIGVLRDYKARFPQGSLQGEVALTLVELYAGSGQAREALAESERLLGTGYGRERSEQLHWLRGNLYRESLRDYVRAQAEYEQINPGAKLGAEALYFTAFCLEQRGQREAARHAYEQYSRDPRATRKAAVLQKLEQLKP